MMREDEVDAAAMDVEDLAESASGHRRALDVPARPTGRGDAAGGRPGRLARPRRLPQHEVHGVLLVGRHFDARARLHLLQRAVGDSRP